MQCFQSIWKAHAILALLLRERLFGEGSFMSFPEPKEMLSLRRQILGLLTGLILVDAFS